MTANTSVIPADLKERRQWVAWRAVAREGKVTKPPYCPATRRKARCDDPTSWTSFNDAVAASLNGCGFDGIGFVLTHDDPFAGIDLDHCRNPETGDIEPWAQQIVASLKSYSEVSPSGTGVHIWLRGKLPADGRRKGQVEMYDSARYLTVTGHRLDGTPATIEDRQLELEALHAKVFGNRMDNGSGEREAEGKPAEHPAERIASDAPATADDELIEKALRSKNAAGKHSFEDVWEGRWRECGYKSQSEASLSLCRHLAFWTGRDPERIDRLFRRSKLYSEKWEREDYRNKTITKAISSTTEVYTPRKRENTHRGEREGNASPYRVSAEGVFYIDPAGENPPLFICSRLDVLGLTRNGEYEDWGRLVRFRDPDGEEHTWALPMEMLSGQGNEYRARLLSMGLHINPGPKAADHLGRYLQTAVVETRFRCVPKVGWHDRAFVLPDETIGTTDEQVLFQSARELEHNFRVSGTLQDWQERIGKRCRGNSRLQFAVSCGFAAPLLNLTDVQGVGFHFRGSSSTGKTTLQRVAGSVWGGGGSDGFVLSWRSTANALEGIAEAHNDCLLCLDEISQLDPKEAGEVAYMLANGSGKSRMNRNSSVRPPASWRVLFLSSGEISLSDHVSLLDRRVRGGQQVRLIDITADAVVGFGVFEDLHGEKSGDAFARQLTEASAAYYGTPIREFLQMVAADPNRWLDWVKEKCESFVRDEVPVGASGEVSRVARHFAVAAAAGELAIMLQVLPWSDGEARAAAARCFESWLAGRGGCGAKDVENAIRQVRAFLEAHGGSRFQSTELDAGIVYNRAGFKKTCEDGSAEYLILQEVFSKEVCVGFDARTVARELKKQGHLITTREERLMIQRRLPEVGVTWVYGIRASLLEGDSK